jgi:hypothetical protein
MTKLMVAVLALAIAGGAAAQSKGKRGAGKGVQRESVDLYHVTAEELRADLKLNDSQAALWERYAKRIEALKEDITRDRARARTEIIDAPRALDRLVDVQRDRLTAMEDIAEAGRALYIFPFAFAAIFSGSSAGLIQLMSNGPSPLTWTTAGVFPV